MIVLPKKSCSENDGIRILIHSISNSGFDRWSLFSVQCSVRELLRCCHSDSHLSSVAIPCLNVFDIRTC